jgi:hypothetical protein
MDDIDPILPLKAHEWIAVSLLIVSLIVITFLTQGDHTALQVLPRTPATHDVVVRGAVAHEGIYRVSTDMSLRELLALVEPNSQADLRRYKLDNPLRKGRIINIRTRKVIRVYVSGAVLEPKEIELYSGARYSDLKGKVALHKNANKTILDRRGLLKDQQKVVIPFTK